MFDKICTFLSLATFVYCTDKNLSGFSFPDTSSKRNDFSYFTKELSKLHLRTEPTTSSKEYSLFPRTRSPEKFPISENKSVIGKKSNELPKKDIKNKKVSVPPGFEREKSSYSNLGETLSKSVGLSGLSGSDFKPGGSSRDVHPATVKYDCNSSSVGSANKSALKSARSWEKATKKPVDSSYFCGSPEVVLFGADIKRKSVVAEKNFENYWENPRVDLKNHVGEPEIDVKNPKLFWEYDTVSKSNRDGSVKPSFLMTLKNSPPKSSNSVITGNFIPSSSAYPANKEKLIGNSFTFKEVGIVSISYKLCTCGGTDTTKRHRLPRMVEICLLGGNGRLLYKAYVKVTNSADTYRHIGVPKECDSGDDIEIVRGKVKEHIAGKILVSFNIGQLLTILNLEHPAYYIRDIQTLAKYCDVIFNQRFVTVRRIYSHFITKRREEDKPDTVYSKADELLQLYLLFENRWNDEVIVLMKLDSNPFRKVNAKAYAQTPVPTNSNVFHMEGIYDGCRKLPRNLVAIHFVIKNNKISHATVIKLARNSTQAEDSKIQDLSVEFPENCSENKFAELRSILCETLKNKVIVGYEVEENIKVLCSDRKLVSTLYDLKKIFKSKENDVMRLASKYLLTQFDNPHSRLKAKIALQFYSLYRFQPSSTKEHTVL